MPSNNAYLSSSNTNLGAADYCVLAAMMGTSMGIGIYYAWKDRNQKTNDEFLMGNESMSTWPVAMSLMASLISSSVVIGWPIEVYVRGSHMIFLLFSIIISSLVSAEIFLPIFHRLHVTSVNKYLYERYDSEVLRTIASLTVLFFNLPYLGTILYGPAVALSSVTDLSTNLSIAMMGAICTVYTTLGGFKAVIWTDVVQYFLMLFGLFALIIKGTIDAGGIFEVFRINKLGGRLEFSNTDWNMYTGANIWCVLLGTLILMTGYYSSNQIQVQRSCSMPTLRKAKEVIYLSLPGFQMFIFLVILTGLVMYANYSRCDPLWTGALERPDQLVPHFVSQSLGDDFPGLPGLFVASVFSASLSTLSSGFNAFATTIWDDFLRGRIPSNYESKSVLITKGIAASLGILSIGLGYLAGEIGSLFEATMILIGGSVGPLFATFFLGMTNPWVNKHGAIWGLLTGQGVCLWIVIGSMINKAPKNLILMSSTEQCSNPNLTLNGFPFESLKFGKVLDYKPTGLDILYHLNPFIVPAVGFFISLLVGVVVSWGTGWNRGKEIDPRYLCGFVNRWRGIDKKYWPDRKESDKHVPIVLASRNRISADLEPVPKEETDNFLETLKTNNKDRIKNNNSASFTSFKSNHS